MRQSWSITRAVVMATAAAAAIALAAAVPPAHQGRALAGDAKIAETLFKSGKQALQKGDTEGAVNFFRRAHQEHSDLVEAIWWVASAQEKAGDRVGSLASYREFLAALEVKSAVTPASKEELRLKGLAERSVAALAAAEKEFQKLEENYVNSLMQFAKDQFARDPGIALKALANLLAIRPDHAAAKDLWEKLGGEDAPEPEPEPMPESVGPFKAVTQWRDLIAEKRFGSDIYSRTLEGLVTDTKTGSLSSPGTPIELGPNFIYECDFKVLEVYGRGWHFGHAFGMDDKNDVWTSVIVTAGTVSILQKKLAVSDATEVATRDLPPLTLNAWHRFGVIVRGTEVDVWLDGKSVLKWTDPSGEPYKGTVGVYHQRCRSVRRLFRVAKVD